jgi:hypothetical protein
MVLLLVELIIKRNNKANLYIDNSNGDENYE